MLNGAAVAAAIIFVLAAFANAAFQKKGTAAVRKAAEFVKFVRTEVRYNCLPSDEILQKARQKRFGELFGENGTPELPSAAGRDAREVFADFCAGIGTTDREGQLEICDCFGERLEEILKTRLLGEKEKIRVNTALCLLGAITVLVMGF